MKNRLRCTAGLFLLTCMAAYPAVAQPPENPIGATPREAPAPPEPIVPNGPPLKLVVTNTKDNGDGSLRQALLSAGTAPGSTISFNIPLEDPNFKDGVFNIQPETPLPAMKGDGTVLDGSTQTAFSGDTNKTGPEIVLTSTNPRTTGRHCLYINAGECVIKSLVINAPLGNAFRYGIQITGPKAIGNKVMGCTIGLNAAGTEVLGNLYGILIESGASDNIIGGVTAEERNVIGGNANQIFIIHPETKGNAVLGNYIGTDAEGEKVFPKTNAVLIDLGASGNFIGGDVAGAGNLICSESAQASGVRIAGAGTTGNVVRGNLIGTNKTGKKIIADCGFGILILNRTEKIQIGGTTPLAGNVIAGYREAGVNMSRSSGHMIQGNRIGWDNADEMPEGAQGIGIILYQTRNATIGGAVAGARNVISGNRGAGILICADDAAEPSTENVIQGNYIGIAADGRTALGNGTNGITMYGPVHNNKIGVPKDGKGRGNTIAFNKGMGIDIRGDENFSPTGNSILRNHIHSNGGLAINLKMPGEEDNIRTPNDEGDADAGPNNGQNYPVLARADADGKRIIKVTLDSVPNTKFEIELFGRYARGRHGIVTEVTTDEAGKSTFDYWIDGVVPVGVNWQRVGPIRFSATATNIATGDTSEFSAEVVVE